MSPISHRYKLVGTTKWIDGVVDGDDKSYEGEVAEAIAAGSTLFIIPVEAKKHERGPDYEIHTRPPSDDDDARYQAAGTKQPQRPVDGPKTVVDI